MHPSRGLSDLVFHPVYLNGIPVSLENSPLLWLIAVEATAVAIWAYNGYGQAVYLGEETRDADKNIARVILWALWSSLSLRK